MDPLTLLHRLRQAVDDHDLDAVAACFAPDYRNETPVHPLRGFEGRGQVRANWQRIFAGLPDVTASIVRTAVNGTTVWSEWELAGTRPGGSPQLLRGVIIFDTSGTEFTSARFYLEPVETATGGVAAAVGRIAGEKDQR